MGACVILRGQPGPVAGQPVGIRGRGMRVGGPSCTRGLGVFLSEPRERDLSPLISDAISGLAERS